MQLHLAGEIWTAAKKASDVTLLDDDGACERGEEISDPHVIMNKSRVESPGSILSAIHTIPADTSSLDLCGESSFVTQAGPSLNTPDAT